MQPSSPASSSAPRPKPRRRIGIAGQRARILEAAAEVFGARGFEHTSVEHVLVSADVSRQTFYRCFRNMNELIEGIQENVTRGLLAAVNVPEGARRADPLGSRMHAFFDYAIELGPVVCELERIAMGPGASGREERDRRFEIGLAVLDAIIREAHGTRLDRATLEGITHACVQLFVDLASRSDDRTERRPRAERAAMALIDAAVISARASERPHEVKRSARKERK